VPLPRWQRRHCRAAMGQPPLPPLVLLLVLLLLLLLLPCQA
jgi:hypothetical protein